MLLTQNYVNLKLTFSKLLLAKMVLPYVVKGNSFHGSKKLVYKTSIAYKLL